MRVELKYGFSEVLGLFALPVFGGMKVSKRMLFLFGQGQVPLLNPSHIPLIFTERLSCARYCSGIRIQFTRQTRLLLSYILVEGGTEEASK